MNSIKAIFSKAKIGGKVLIVGIRDIAEKHNREKFIKVYDEGEKYIKGLFRLSDEVTLEATHYFHKEKEIKLGIKIQNYMRYKKEGLGVIVPTEHLPKILEYVKEAIKEGEYA